MNYTRIEQFIQCHVHACASGLAYVIISLVCKLLWDEELAFNPILWNQYMHSPTCNIVSLSLNIMGKHP